MAEQMPLKIVVLAGGPSAEAEVSRQTGAQIQQALASLGHQVSTLELSADCASVLLRNPPDVVFPALHGPPGEDGTVQGFLEILGLPYVGSDVHGSAVAMDKSLAKNIFRRYQLPVLEDIVVQPGDDLTAVAAVITQKFADAVVIKPLNQGSAIGVNLMPDGGDILGALKNALAFGGAMVEPFVSGREITAGVMETETGLLSHPVIEIITADNQWYDYNNRYTPGQSQHVMPAELSADLTHSIQTIAKTAHQALGLRDLSRSDFILTDDNQITLLEVNTLPGMTPVSLFPEGAAGLGYAFTDLVELLVRKAHARSKPKRDFLV